MAKEYLIEDILTRIKRPIELEDNKEYELVTIRSKHRGVVPRGAKKGFEIKSNMYKVKSGDFILSGIDARHGAFGIIPPELDGAIVTNDFWYFEIDDNVISKELFLELTATSWFDEICKNGSDGTTNRIRLQKKKFFNQKILLPEFHKQENLLSKFQQIKRKNTLLSGELEKQKNLVSDLKQSILQEAIEGKLTQAWRAENPNVEPAHKLLERIKAEKSQLIKEKKIKKEKPLPKITKAEIPFDLPVGWVWCRLGEIIILKSGQDLGKHQYSDDKEIGLPYITGASNLQKGNVIINRWTNSPKSIANRGDLLLTCKGSGVGKMAFLDTDKVHIARQIMGIKAINVNLEYIKNYLSTKIEYFKSSAKSLIPGIDRATVLNCVFPLPPTNEKGIIVEKIQNASRKINTLEQEIKASETHAQMLMQAVLKEAFETA